MRDKGKSIMNEGNPSKINLTFEISKPIRTLKESKIEFKKRKMTFELNKKIQDVWVARLF
jgi:hypothetical protein